MIDLSPRWVAVALAAALTASPVLDAAAQGDAAFASALAARPAWLATMAQLKTRPQVPPAAHVQGPVAPAEAWQKILDGTIRDGAYSVDPETKVPMYQVEVTGVDMNGNDALFKILALATPRADGKVTVHFVLLSYMTVRSLSKDSAQADNYFLEVTGSGRLQKATRASSVTRGNTTVDQPPVVMDLAAAETKTVFDDVVKYWTE